jgi:NADH-quinone oxidoreductase subunit L
MSNLTWIVTLIPAFPLLGFLVNALFIRRERAAGLIASGAVVLSFVTTLISIGVLTSLQSTAEAGSHTAQRISVVLWEWISVGTFRVPFGLLFDQLTAVMALLVTGVGALIHIYSIGYIHGDERPVRFFAYLNLFIAAMLFLIMGDNLLLLFLGWEGVGLCSFLLIGHWFDRNSVQPGIVPSQAAVKAFVANRVGDVGMLLAMFAIFSNFGSLNFVSTVMPDGGIVNGFLDQVVGSSGITISLGVFGSIGLLTAISYLLLIGVTGKSAQIPLFVWLPDAMAGPTPVSALIHAATMVTSGVYLMVRTYPLFEMSPSTQSWALVIGSVTAILGATAAVAQFDIKRVLAYSTISQLGFMVAAVALGAYVAAIFHLLTHGIFKALLFLGSGSIIHGVHDNQDMRKMGGLREKMPKTYITYMIGAFALAGIVPLAGFWSKDEILAAAWGTSGNPGAGVMLLLASVFTAFYMGRQIALVFFGRPRDTSAEHAHESGSLMVWPLFILAAGAVLGGLINLPGLHWLEHWLEPVFTVAGTRAPAPAHFSWGVAIWSTLLAVAAGYTGWWLYTKVIGDRVRPGRDDPAYRYTGDFWRLAEMGWGFDWLYEQVVVRPYNKVSRFFATEVDERAIDGVLVDGTASLFGRAAQLLRRGQNGSVRTYALVFLVGVLGLISYFVFLR